MLQGSKFAVCIRKHKRRFHWQVPLKVEIYECTCGHTHNTCTQAHRHNTHTHTHAPLSSVTVVPLYTLLMPPSRNSCFAQSIELEYRAFPVESCWIWRAGGKETHMCYIPPPPSTPHTHLHETLDSVSRSQKGYHKCTTKHACNGVLS